MHNHTLIAAARAAGRTSLDERSGKQLLAQFGLAVPNSIVVTDTKPTADTLGALRAPYVVKVMSPDILHKSDVGGVRVRLQSADEVALAIQEMRARPQIARAHIDGFLVEEMAPPGQEIVIGGLRDPQFGPLIMVGLGGVFVEVLQDVAFRICPIEQIDALEMLDELKGKAMLDGLRGGVPASRDALIDALMKIGGEGGLLTTFGDDIAEVDVNPLIVSPHGAVAADARFILTPEAPST